MSDAASVNTKPTANTRSWKKQVRDGMISRAVYLVFMVIKWTCRFRYYGADLRLGGMKLSPNGGHIIAVLHEHAFGSIAAHAFQRLAPIISLSSDGEIVDYISRKMGMTPVRGSSSRGGAKAKNDLVELVNSGKTAAITVDGPRGPRRKAKFGVASVSSSCEVAIVPSVTIADKKWVLKTWDQFQLPKPFSTINTYYGEPIAVPGGVEARDDLAAWADKVTKALDELDRKGTDATVLQNEPSLNRVQMVSKLNEIWLRGV
jgi:lysophospholipid acyltransferase (LPLAT)-like uncharacterized protein